MTIIRYLFLFDYSFIQVTGKKLNMREVLYTFNLFYYFLNVINNREAAKKRNFLKLHRRALHSLLYIV